MGSSSAAARCGPPAVRRAPRMVPLAFLSVGPLRPVPHYRDCRPALVDPPPALNLSSSPEVRAGMAAPLTVGARVDTALRRLGRAGAHRRRSRSSRKRRLVELRLCDAAIRRAETLRLARAPRGSRGQRCFSKAVGRRRRAEQGLRGRGPGSRAALWIEADRLKLTGGVPERGAAADGTPRRSLGVPADSCPVLQNASTALLGTCSTWLLAGRSRRPPSRSPSPRHRRPSPAARAALGELLLRDLTRASAMLWAVSDLYVSGACWPTARCRPS